MEGNSALSGCSSSSCIPAAYPTTSSVPWHMQAHWAAHPPWRDRPALRGRIERSLGSAAAAAKSDRRWLHPSTQGNPGEATARPEGGGTPPPRRHKWALAPQPSAHREAHPPPPRTCHYRAQEEQAGERAGGSPRHCSCRRPRSRPAQGAAMEEHGAMCGRRPLLDSRLCCAKHEVPGGRACRLEAEFTSSRGRPPRGGFTLGTKRAPNWSAV